MADKLLLAVLLAAPLTFAQVNPGPRPGPPGAPPTTALNTPPGPPLAGLTQAELAWFQEGLIRFREIDSVSGTQPGASGSGLGPRFNLNSCIGCHAHPGPGGSSPPVNPQIPVATSFGATNTIPSFITQNGPVRLLALSAGPTALPMAVYTISSL